MSFRSYMQPCDEVDSNEADKSSPAMRSFWSRSDMDGGSIVSATSLWQLVLNIRSQIPFITSVSSIRSIASSGSSTVKELTGLNRPISKSRFRYLSAEICLVLLVELTILLSILAVSSCSFYNVTVSDTDNHSFVFQTGIYRYSISSEVFQLDCTSYGSSETQIENPILSSWLKETTSMVKASQALSIATPIVAAIACLSIGVEVFMPKCHPGIWFTQMLLFLAGIFQALVIALFEEGSAWYVFI